MDNQIQNNLFEETEDRITYFADIILPVSIPNLFTYRVPFEWNDIIKVGCRVIVQFGVSRILTGIVAQIHQKPPEKYNAKYLLELLEEFPSVTGIQLNLFSWMANYYMCNIGDVANAALPSGLKINNKSYLQLNPEFKNDELITDKEKILFNLIKIKGSVPYEDAEKITDQKSVHKHIRTLIDKKAILIFEEIKEKYTPKILKKIKIKSFYLEKENLEALFKVLEKNPKQIDVLLKYLSKVPVINQPELNEYGLEKAIFAKLEISGASLNTLIKNEIFEEFEIIVSRFDYYKYHDGLIVELTEDQKIAKEEILFAFETTPVVLLHGITGSGKTAVYIDLIKNALESGSQVLYLLPEIALTTQIVERLKKVFGDSMGVYHSKFSDNERVEVWKEILQGKYSFVVGVRSAVLLPFDNLGLVIVDEEHETTYKQYDNPPRYNARDVAIVLAKMHNSKVLLGSATPSVESYSHAMKGKYGFVKLDKRYGEAQLPEVILVDTAREKKEKKMKNIFSSVLLDALQLNFQKKEQSILFQNRRGYSAYLACEECNYIPKCPQCDVSLTYHQYSKDLRCHYCGYKEGIPSFCPACGSTKIKTIGIGTEKIEDDLKILIPDASIQRMDRETTGKKNAYNQIIEDFENSKTDILVGTQMVSKGLDFDKVSIVGIFDADRTINFPDFRSHERTFQLLTQVSGRSGRRDVKGKVFIQTANVHQKILKQIVENNFVEMYNDEIEEREKFNYPPFVRLIKIVLRHKDKHQVQKAAVFLAENLRKKNFSIVLGPEAPLVERIRNLFIQEILIKIKNKDSKSLIIIKEKLNEEIQRIVIGKQFKNINIFADVDPY